MFTDAMKESQQEEITLNGVTAIGVKHILDYAYSSKVTLSLGKLLFYYNSLKKYEFLSHYIHVTLVETKLAI